MSEETVTAEETKAEKTLADVLGEKDARFYQTYIQHYRVLRDIGLGDDLVFKMIDKNLG